MEFAREMRSCLFNTFVLVLFVVFINQKTFSDEAGEADKIAKAVERALPLLEIASSGSADQRTCFTCHSQALPIFALTKAIERGFHVDSQNLQRQTQHTFKHLKRGRKSYEEGKGQGGGVDTAGYALWSLEDAEIPEENVIPAVTNWIINQQKKDGSWRCSSNRPPTEASHFTTTYLALRALSHFGTDKQHDSIRIGSELAEKWLINAEAKDTEDSVFRLLSYRYVNVDEQHVKDAIEHLLALQQSDGGWGQLPESTSDAYATATALFALHEAAAVTKEDQPWKRGIDFLLGQQLEDGSWWVKSRSKPFQLYYETGFPHRTDQFVSTSATSWATMVLLEALPERQPSEIVTMTRAETRPLEYPESDLSQRLMQVAHKFVEAQISQANSDRKPVLGESETADLRRQALRTVLGVVEQPASPRMEHFGNVGKPAILAQTDQYEILQVRWPALADVDGEGLLIRQKGEINGRIVLIPDANQTPESLLGFNEDQQKTRDSTESVSDNATSTIGLQLAENGFEIIIPKIVSRNSLETNHTRRKRANYSQREWIYRQAFHMGRHVIGYDLASVLACYDWFETREKQVPLGIVGYGEGGLLALHAAAIDTRIEAALVSGYFDDSDAIWREPIYRNVWSRLKHFGNAEVAALVSPRKVVIEHCEFPTVADQKGVITTPEFKSVEDEFKKIPNHENFAFLVGSDKSSAQPFSGDALAKFCEQLGCESPQPPKEPSVLDQHRSTAERIREREKRHLAQLERHVQSLIHRSDAVRDESFLYQVAPEFRDSRWSTERQHATLDPNRLIEASKLLRKRFREDVIGEFTAARVPLNPRTRKVAETESWIAYDVVLDVYEGLFAWGLLVIPKDIQPGQRRPVVVCQHGRNGVPRDTLDTGSTAYNDFAARLAERGFITFAPHNLYRGEDQYRWLDRKANTIGCTLFSFILAQHEACLDWLRTLPFVKEDQIAFYGLSYGGETAVRIPPILENYCLSICSGDFNQWTRKVASTNHDFSFMNTIEWEMPYWNMGNTFDYAEMAALMFPRPFMVERGHHDRVAKDQWVAHEFAKLRWLYAQFGMADRLRIEFFQGGHSIRGEGTFQFLEDQLKTRP